MSDRVKSWRGVGLGLVLSVLTTFGGAAEQGVVGASPTVAVVRSPAWSQGDPAREGAAEFAILMQIARLQQASAKGGLVAVGDRRGLFSEGAEEALRRAVLQGVPVVKLAERGQVLRAPHDLFLDGGSLNEDEARQVLASCLEQYGSLPIEATRRRERLQLFQQAFSVAAGLRVAVR